MDLNLAGKSVVITGGSRGIGYACAEAFASEGCGVIADLVTFIASPRASYLSGGVIAADGGGIYNRR
jgi:NAD(P)-dependent dehydrogenase (short-subunit alcohol dehydrogenase family)